MASVTANVTLGTGTLYLNNVDVGHLKGDVTLVAEGENVDFKPSAMTGPVKRFVIRESARLTASLAELKMANVRLAMGVTTAVTSSSSFPSHDPSSYSAPASSSYDVMTFGGDKTVSEVSLRFEHTRPGTTKKVIVIFYKSVSNRALNLPFHEEDITLQEVTWEALADEDRTAGDQMGFIADEVQQAG
jgi:hypothetical protein